MQGHFEFIVVGAGTAGCILAARLAKSARVLLIDAGGEDSSPWIHVPVGWSLAIILAVLAGSVVLSLLYPRPALTTTLDESEGPTGSLFGTRLKNERRSPE